MMMGVEQVEGKEATSEEVKVEIVAEKLSHWGVTHCPPY